MTYQQVTPALAVFDVGALVHAKRNGHFARAVRRLREAGISDSQIVKAMAASPIIIDALGLRLRHRSPK